ncbi:hypothetical protein ColLi_09099 [Colletotrichum liriopes]|uniref:Uncharacterized protein n=1 Tax=Colletotrichum liriopes TaxID=708192 RepID=A0AA37LW04_9PEZI|nr:hypothetical protein ColLi_09099 [Colletotrichum liriopes]
MECAGFLGRDIIKRDPISLSFSHPIVEKKEVVAKEVKRPIDASPSGRNEEDVARRKPKGEQKTTWHSHSNMAIIAKSYNS